jgi:muramidase (phage lysozyme)
MTPNERAFLFMIAISELGPLIMARSDCGYDVIVGSTKDKLDLMKSYADHPRKTVTLVIKGQTIKSTAAGRYQILSRYFDHYKQQLRLPDFSPASQDAIALQLIRECRALDDVRAGRFAIALSKCRSRWASLPGAGYGQHENDAADLQAAYVQAGGTLA